MTTGMDFFDAVNLPVPSVDEAWARRAAQESFGVDAVADALGSNQDANFLLRSRDGQPLAVLKVSNPAVSAAEVSAQDAAADRIAAMCPDLRVDVALAGLEGVGGADAIWPLVALRAAVLVTSGCHQLDVDGDNAYAESRLVREWRIADQALAIPIEVMTALIRDTLGLDPRRGQALSGDSAGVLLAVPDAEVLDLSAQSALLDDGAWLTTGIAEALAGERLTAGRRAVTTKFGESRLAGNGDLGQAPGWLALLDDPAPQLGLPATPAPQGVRDGAGAARDVLQLRERVLATVQEHYYREPPQIERGWRHRPGADFFVDPLDRVLTEGW